MIEDVEELRVEAKRDVLCDWNRFGHVNLGVGEMRPPIVVAARVAELAVDGRISTGTSAGAGIDYGGKGVWVEPLPAAGLRHAGDWRFAIERDSGDSVRVLRAAALKDAVVVGRVRCAEDAERHSAVQECCLRYLPAAEHLPQQCVAGMKWNLLNAERRNVLTDIVFTITVFLL